MRFRTLIPVVLILGLVGVAPETRAQTQIVDVDSNSNCPIGNAVQVALTAGSWTVTPIDDSGPGAFTAWNAWGGNVIGCDGGGANCDNGWLTTYRIVAPDVPDNGFGGGVYETDDLAFQNSAEGTLFTLSSDQTVSFYINDSNCSDNVGGVSFDVSPAQVPTVSGGWPLLLFAVALLAGSLLLLRVRNRSTPQTPAS